MMNWKYSQRFLLYLSALLPAAPQLLSAAEKSTKAQAEFTLRIPIKDAGILRDGSTIEPLGKATRGKIGLNEVTVSAPGYGVRRLRFWLKAGDKAAIDGNLAKIRNRIDPEWKSLDRVLPSARIAKLPSVCGWYHDKTNDTNVCRRQSFFEDLAFAEAPLYVLDDMRALASATMLTSYRELVNQGPTTDAALEAQAEGMFRMFPDNGSVFQLNSALALRRGDCPRVHAIFVDAQQVLENPSPLLLYKALCFEIQGQTEAAIMLLQDTIKSNKTPAAYLSYHLGRLLLRKAPDMAQELANFCLKSFRFDLSCQELGMMSARLAQKIYKVQRFNLEEGTFKTFRNLEEGLPKGQAEALFFSVISLLSSYPHSLEFYLFLAWIDAEQNIQGGLNFYASKMQVGAILASSGLESIVESLEKQNLSRLLPPVYRARVRNEPNDPNLWLRLIRAYSKAGQCLEVIRAVQEGAAVLPKYNTQLLQIEGACYMQLSRFEEALDSYLKVLTAQPKVWSTYYNLAAVYERLKRKKEAVDHYQMALLYNPPVDVRDSIGAKILELHSAAIKSREKQP